ncbi:hypothetical protein EVAR_5322_1 [Eumeta japonica]|uniref:Uncharacterized protein n=1 Tax=Eumeta variegata TaxID=151549 RepID=A0A4C1TNW9_EUMVA|nr:hypothetical protein EVAR_5322_1 [Eumeta japonica]
MRKYAAVQTAQDDNKFRITEDIILTLYRAGYESCLSGLYALGRSGRRQQQTADDKDTQTFERIRTRSANVEGCDL